MLPKNNFIVFLLSYKIKISYEKSLNIITIATMSLILFGCGKTGKKSSNVTSSTTIKSEKRVNYSPYLEDNYPNNEYFGDTHLHTSFSTPFKSS
jgi:hypothetical protein